jgi:excisionase family DNA binding protein
MAKNLSTFAIAEMLRVDPGSVANWIDQGLLKAHRTPGGHRRVVSDDLMAFLRDHKMPVPTELSPPPARILVVDDDKAVAQVVVRGLRMQHPDFDIREANDGFQAGALVATLRPDIVILDLHMEGMDGYEVCRMIKAQEATKHADVIAITGFPSPENEQRIRQCGARVCLPKPLELATLLAEVEKSL